VAGNPLYSGHLLKIIAELLFLQAVNPFYLLLFPKLQGIVGQFGTGLAMLAGRELPFYKGTFLGHAFFALQKKLHALSAASSTIWS